MSYPEEASSLFTAQSAQFTVTEREVAVGVVNNTNYTKVGRPFSVVAKLIDAMTSNRIVNIAWRVSTFCYSK